MQAAEALNSGCLACSAVCALLLMLSWALITIRRQQRHKLPPGPLSLPVVGNLLHFMGDLPHVRLARLAERHGPLLSLRLGSSMLAVVASSADMARAFLQTHDKVFASRPTNLFMERAHFGAANAFPMGPYGPHWRHIRKVATLELFSPRRVQETQALRREEVLRLLHSLGAQADVAASVDLARAMSSMVEDLLCRIIFGRRMSDMAVGAASLKDLVSKATELFQAPVLGDFLPWLGFLDRGVKRRMDKLHTEIDALCECLINEREKQHEFNKLQGKKSPPENLLDVLLLDPSLSRLRVKGYVLDLLVAGIDTTSATLDWIMAELINNPSVLSKLRLEIEGVVGRDRIVGESDMVDLPYVTATVKEGLRLHAPVSLLLPHMATKACDVMGYSLPQGTMLFVNAWAIGRDPATWNDPDRFSPERFLLTQGDPDPSQQLWWIPFGSGRRSCPGAPLALPTLELTIANLVHCFDWRLPDGQTHVDMSAKTSLVVCRKQPLIATPILLPNRP